MLYGEVWEEATKYSAQASILLSWLTCLYHVHSDIQTLNEEIQAFPKKLSLVNFVLAGINKNDAFKK